MGGAGHAEACDERWGDQWQAGRLLLVRESGSIRSLSAIQRLPASGQLYLNLEQCYPARGREWQRYELERVVH